MGFGPTTCGCVTAKAARHEPLKQVLDNTGFEIDVPETVAITPEPEADRLALLRSSVGMEVADTYPAFARDVLGIAA